MCLFTGHASVGSPKYGFNTMESRKSRQRQRFVRKSSLPLEGNATNGNGLGSVSSNSITNGSSSIGSAGPTSSNSSATGNSNTSLGGAVIHSNGMGICRAETFPVLIDCIQGSGIVLGAPTKNGRAVTIAQIIPDSVADRSGCIQKGDRIVAINKMYNLDVPTMRQLLGDTPQRPTTANAAANWLELEIEFDMPDAVVPSSGVYNVKLFRSGKSGLGLSVNGSSHGGFVISDVKPGSPAHRTGSLRAGDILLAVDNHAIQHFNVDSLLKERNGSDFTTLTVKRVMLPDFLFDAQQKMPNHIYSNCPLPNTNGNNSSEHDLYSSAYVTSKYAEVKYNDCISLKSITPQPEYFRSSNMDDASLQSVKMRNNLVAPSNMSTNTWSPSSLMGRSFGMVNTQSLTTELPEEETDYNDFAGYDLERYAR